MLRPEAISVPVDPASAEVIHLVRRHCHCAALIAEQKEVGPERRAEGDSTQSDGLILVFELGLRDYDYLLSAMGARCVMETSAR
jgi:hypothetical protein